MAEAHGPKPLAELSRELRARGRDSWSELLQGGMESRIRPPTLEGFLRRRFFSPMRNCCVPGRS